MPCNNVTERIRIEIDSQDRLKSYRLRKLNCGGEVGNESLLNDRLQNRTVTEIGNLDPTIFSRDNVEQDRIGTFLCMKHLFAIQLALETLTGKINGGAKSDCRIIGINYDIDGLTFEAEIGVDIVTSKIKACGGACGTKKR